MLTLTRTSLLTALVVAVSACGTGSPSNSGAGISPLPGNNSTSGMVLSGPDLYEHSGNLLGYLYSRVAGMSVDYGAAICPRVQMRGRKSMLGSSDPIVYVDGARTANSCVLEMLQTRDLSRVEVYPMGVTNRPGYEAHPNGLILVFLRNGSEPRGTSRLSD